MEVQQLGINWEVCKKKQKDVESSPAWELWHDQNKDFWLDDWSISDFVELFSFANLKVTKTTVRQMSKSDRVALARLLANHHSCSLQALNRAVKYDCDKPFYTSWTYHI